jgi:HipA-like protein
MRSTRVFYKKKEAGIISQLDDGTFHFRYHDQWMSDPGKPAISLTLPKTQQEYYAPYLFSFFINMLPEGVNKEVVCKTKRIDPDDYFSLLIATAWFETIGAVTVSKSA